MATATRSTRTATYTLLFCGPTKFGRRAKLSFRDGTKEFWVDASAIVEGSAGGRDSAGLSIRDGSSYRAGVTAPHGQTCPQCGSRECAKAWDRHDLCDED